MGISVSQMQKGDACPSLECDFSGSRWPVLGAPALPQQNRAEEQDDGVLLEGDLPPDPSLAHPPKMAYCEACQGADMYHR
jgi:hypothetical protein